MDKLLYFLIGPKGSGKTYIGTYIDEHTDIHFLRVEALWLALKEGEDGWIKVADAVEEAFLNNNRVMIENLGAGEGFNNFFALMNENYRTRLIRVETDLDLCFERVKNRDQRAHINVSDDKVLEYNRIAAKVELDWDLKITNNGDTPLSTIKDKILDLK